MTTLRLVLGDQLSPGISSLADLDPGSDVVLLVEVAEEATYVRHHKAKIAFVLSAMRHFAEELRGQGVHVDYVTLDDPANTHGFSGEVRRAVERHGARRLVVTEPGEWRVRQMMEGWAADLGIPVEIADDDRFLCPHPVFRDFAKGRRQLRMEHFYREMRRRTGFLMDGDEPVGGRWNLDHDNRKAPPRDLAVPRRPSFPPDAITRAVIDLVARRFGNHFGDLEAFNWPVTRADAERAFEHFAIHHLPGFGDYQDAMVTDEPAMFHALVSPMLNVGLLDPHALCVRAEQALRSGEAPLNAVEGFVRQVLGWREYVRGIYWLKMPDYRESNALHADRPIPDFYWTGQTDMACLSRTIEDTRRHAYAHHIQRLMVTGNFALLAGLRPSEVEEWYLVVYADAYEWVELPNTHGMALFADGGLLASKPYAASGAYINRMSDYCAGCRFDPKQRSGPGACPFNLLYWDFLMRNEDRLSGNPRMAMPYRTLRGFDEERRRTIRAEAAAFLDGLPVYRP